MSWKPADADIETPSGQSIDRRLSDVRRLAEQGFQDQSLVLGFSVLEAVARFAVGLRLAKPQPPLGVVEMLAFEGIVAPSEADDLRQLIKKRHRIVHGDLDVAVTTDELETFMRIIDAAWTFAKTPASQTA
jgi:uncharacterized protein YutE (UPF0331/DUF86 family)